MAQQMVTIPKSKYLKLKQEAGIDREFLKDLMKGLMDIKAGRIKRVL